MVALHLQSARFFACIVDRDLSDVVVVDQQSSYIAYRRYNQYFSRCKCLQGDFFSEAVSADNEFILEGCLSSKFFTAKEDRYFQGQPLGQLFGQSFFGFDFEMFGVGANESYLLYFRALIPHIQLDFVAAVTKDVFEEDLSGIDLGYCKGTVTGGPLRVLLSVNGANGKEFSSFIESKQKIQTWDSINQMLDSKFKKQIGFIKTHSSKNNIREKAHFDSSDSFSSFEYDPKAKNEEFSPYKHPLQPTDKIQKKTFSQSKARPDLMNHPKAKIDRDHPKFSNLILRNNFIQETKSKQRDINQRLKNQLINQELESINRQIKDVKNNFERSKGEFEEYELDGKETPKLPDEMPENIDVVDPHQDEELSMSNINKFKKSQEEYTSNLLPLEVEQNCPKTLAQYKKYLDESSSGDEEELRNKQTFKNKSYKREKGFDEELITQWDKREFKDKTMKTAILQHNLQNAKPQQKQGVLEAKGGLCFEVDTRQFKGTHYKPAPERKRKRKPETNTREQLLIRRQTAKRFDRESRVRIFGYI